MTSHAVSSAPPSGPGVLADFHPAVRAWFEARFPEGPTEPQQRGWPEIRSGRDTLVAAPTGSGKTLSGFLVAIDALYRAHDRGRERAGTTRVVYVSPLKALAVDIHQNLERPLARDRGDGQGAGPGRARPDRRRADRRHSQLGARRHAQGAADLPDHHPGEPLPAGDRRAEPGAAAPRRQPDRRRDPRHGSRQARLAPGPHPRAPRRTCSRARHRSASACRPPSDRSSRSVACSSASATGRRRPSSTADTSATSTSPSSCRGPSSARWRRPSSWARSSTGSPTHVREHRTTLVFVNTRRLSERLAHQLGERLGPEQVAAHHGSLSRERRQRVEARLRAGDLRALVATASLELGIDIGPVELVCQVGSPRSIATFLQRVGRSNHSRAGTPSGRLFRSPATSWSSAPRSWPRSVAGRLDALQPPVAPLDILAQQVVAEVAAEEWKEDDLFELFRHAAPYAQLDERRLRGRARFRLRRCADRPRPPMAYLHRDRVNGVAARTPRRPTGRADQRRRHPRGGRLPGAPRPGRHLRRHGQRGLRHRVDGR